MSRFEELLEKYQDGTEPFGEGAEFARLLQEDELRRLAFYDAVLLEVDLYESYAGIAQMQAVPLRRKGWRRPATLMGLAAAALILIGLAALLRLGRATPAPAPQTMPAAPKPQEAPPPPKAPEPAPRPTERRAHRESDDDREHGDRKSEDEREYQKELREVERLRERGNLKEADEKLREIERERQKRLQRQGRRDDD